MDDLISRQAAIDIAPKLIITLDGYEMHNQAVANYCAEITQLPPAQPERIKARWLPIGMADAVGGESAMWGDEIAYHACDNCWQQALEKDGEEILSDFCPCCGADMKGEDNETD